MTTLPNGLTTKTEVGKVARPTCSKTMSGASPRISLTRLAKAREALKRSLSAAGSARFSSRPHHLAELVAVDVVDGAELLDQLALLGRGDDADRVGAGRLAELGREDAEAAGGAPDQDVVAGLQLALVDQHPVGGEVGEPVGGGVDPGEVLRARQQLLGLDLGELGEGAPGRLVAPDPLARRRERVEAVDLDVLVGGLVAVDHDLVAGLPAGHALADLPDDPGGVGAADVVAVLGVVAVAEDRDRLAERRPDVVEVDPGGHHPDDHLEGARARGPRSARAGRRPSARPRAPGGSPRPPSSPAASRARRPASRLRWCRLPNRLLRGSSLTRRRGNPRSRDAAGSTAGSVGSAASAARGASRSSGAEIARTVISIGSGGSISLPGATPRPSTLRSCGSSRRSIEPTAES